MDRDLAQGLNMLNFSYTRVRLARTFCLSFILMIVAPMGPAAPLGKGTLLTITQGKIGYPEGTCSGSYLRYLSDAINCYPLGPGLDGGWVVGKNQGSGGQELGPSAHRAQDGQLSNAFSRLGYATLGTAPMRGAIAGRATTDAALNRFDDVSCSAAACLGKVEINTLHQAYDGHVLPGGCAVADCASTGGSGVMSWQVNPDRSYHLDATWDLVQVHLEGSIVQPGDTLPRAAAVNMNIAAGETVQWKPLVSTTGNDPLRCVLLPKRYAFYGTMTLAADCSSGVYISPNPLFTGRECRQYQVSDGKNVSTPAEVCIKISPQERRATKQKI